MRDHVARLDEASQRTTRPVRRYQIGDGVVAVYAAAHPALERLLTALAPLRLPADSGPADLVLHVWDASQDPLARPVSALFARDGVPPEGLGGYSDAGMNAFFQPGAGALSVFDPVRKRAHWWLRDAAAAPYFERAAPFKHVLQWWVASRGGALLHSAAVASAHGDRSVLIAGPSGSGKSSTALACVEHGLAFASDDYVIIDGGEPPRVHLAYATAKVVRGSLARFPAYAARFCNLDAAGEKPMLFMHEHTPAAMRISSRPVALVLPRIAHRATTTFTPVAGATMLRALAPSSLMLFPLAGRHAFSRMAALCQGLPCLRADLADDPKDVAAAFAALLEPKGVARATVAA
jgi:hypothetical protein